MNFPELWCDYVDTLKQSGGNNVEIITEVDFTYLKHINAHPQIVEAAKVYPGVHDGGVGFHLGMPEVDRQWAPDIFTNALPIGEDGAGNYFVWLDPSDINSNILFLCHDPAIIQVVANNIFELLEGLLAGLKSPTYHDKGESSWGNYSENAKLDEMVIWKRKLYNGENGELDLRSFEKNGVTHFDFSNAKRRAGVSMLFNGKYTKVETPKTAGMLSLGIMHTEKIKANKNRDLKFYGMLAVTFSGLLYYNLSTGKPILRSVWASAIWVILGFMIIATALGFWTDFTERVKNKNDS